MNWPVFQVRELINFTMQLCHGLPADGCDSTYDLNDVMRVTRKTVQEGEAKGIESIIQTSDMIE